MLSDVVRAFSRSGALKYYAWLAVATAVHHLVFTYWQALQPDSTHRYTPAADWAEPSPALLPRPPPLAAPPPPPCGASSRRNGWVSVAASLLGGCAALLPLFCERWLDERRCARLRSTLVLVAPLLLSALLYAMAVAGERHDERLAASYDAAFVAYHVLHELMRVVCDAEGARCVAHTAYRGAPRFALVGGIATTATLALQSLAQLLGSRPGLGLPLHTQFKLLAAMLLALFAVCLGAACVGAARTASGWRWCDHGRRSRSRRVASPMAADARETLLD